METVSARFLEAIRSGGGRWYGYVEASYDGTPILFDDEHGATTTHLPLDRDGQNEVMVGGSTPGVRRTLRVTCPRQVGLWEKLAPVGTELRPYAAIRFPDGSTEVIAQGVFDVDVQSMSYAPGGSLSITAPDRWARVQRARFLTPRLLGGATVQTVIADLIEEAVPGSTVSDTTTPGGTLPKQTEERDRAGFIERAATSASLDVFFDRNGVPTIRELPTLEASGVWTVDAGLEGVLLAADRERNRQKTYNIVVVNGETNDGVVPFATQYVWDNNADSPTYAGSGTGSGSSAPSAGSAGPFGQRPFFYTSPLLTNATQAQVAGASILARVTGLAAQLTLSAVWNPALEDGDTVAVRLPRPRRDLPQVTERHIVDRFSVPLVPHRNAQRLETRSTVADIEEAA